MGYRTFLFDLDGTLIDTVALIQRSFHETVQHYGRPPVSDGDIVSVMGRPLEACFRELSGQDAPIADMVVTYREINRELHDDMVRPYPGVVETVERLRGEDVVLAIVTSKIGVDARRGLRVAGIDHAFEVVIGAHEVDEAKPHPEPVLTALRQVGADAEGAVIVGDSVHDMESGRRAGVATAAALWGPNGRSELEPANPDHWLERIEDVERLFV